MFCNSGYILPVVDMSGNPYLLTVSRNPQGDRFNGTYIYLPWNEEQTVLSGAWVYIGARGVYGQEDEGESNPRRQAGRQSGFWQPPSGLHRLLVGDKSAQRAG